MTAPWRSDDELAQDDAELAEMTYQNRLSLEVEERAYRLRVDELARAKLRAEKVAATDFDAQYLDRAALLDLPTPDPLIKGVLPRHAYAILRGRDHSFKSFVAIDWALCLATGKTWQSHPVEPVRVLYIAGEGAHGLRARIDAWEYGWGRTVPPHMLTVRRTALDLHRPGPAFDHLLAHVQAGGYGLVIVDTLRRVSGAADGNTSEMGLVVDNLDRIKHATDNGTVLAVAHTDKGDNDTRGYSGIEDDADVVWAAKRDDVFLSLQLTKMKDGPDGRTLDLMARKMLDSLVIQDAAAAPQEARDNTENQQKVLETLRETGPDGMPGGVLRKLCELSDATFYRAVNKLHETGQIQNIGTPKARVWALPALNPDSQPLSPDEPAPDQQDSHDSHELSPDSHHSLSLSPPLGVRGESNNESNNSDQETQ